MPQIGWASAFVLGAIISPPDAVAAGAVFERFSVPRRILAILDGEGLVNDATALVIYGFGVTAVLTRSFSLSSAGIAFVVVAVGGIALGLAFGFADLKLLMVLRKYDLTDHLIGTTIQLILPYTIYLSGQALHVSGVLATVTAGIFVSRKANLVTNAAGRIVAFAVWDLLIFLLNGFAFLLIGLELRSIVHDPSFAKREIWIGLEISVLVIALRFAWVYPATYLPRLIFLSINRREGLPGWNYIFIIAWSGMRGIVSLASALALPLKMNDGRAFPGRDEIIFISFCVIFITLVFQGLSLIPLLKWLRIDGDDLPEREIEVRVAALRAGIAGLHELEPNFNSTEEWEVEGRILGEYEYRIAHLLGHLDGSVSETDVAYDHQLQQKALEAERREIARLRDSGQIPDDVFRNIQYDLDLADERLN
jgi:CPA1 family monovalent cation:H+ antiporter